MASALTFRVIVGLVFGFILLVAAKAGPVTGTGSQLVPVPRDLNPSLTGALGCGLFTTADKRDAIDLVSGLSYGGDCTTPGRTCRRHACKNTSGIYVCNDNDYPLILDCHVHVSYMAGDILSHCCTSGADKSVGISGQKFWDENRYNVIIAYANCNHGIDSDNPSKGPDSDPWGPNGSCDN